MQLIAPEILDKAKKEAEKGIQFLVISYDIPSEQLSKKVEQKRILLGKRMEISKYCGVNGIYLNNSSYIIPIAKIEEVIKKFDETYADLDLDKFPVNVKIIGSAYAEVVKDILLVSLKNLYENLKAKLELIEAKIDEARGKTIEFDKLQELQKQLYAIRPHEKILENRVEDLKAIDTKLATDYFAKRIAIGTFRLKLIRMC